MARKGDDLVKGVDADLDELLATLKQVASRLDRLLERAAPKVEGFLDAITRAAANLEALAKDFQGLGPEARTLLRNLGADATEMVRTLTDTAHNLLDTSEDVRSRPWVLLNKPEYRPRAAKTILAAAARMQSSPSSAPRMAAAVPALLEARKKVGMRD